MNFVRRWILSAALALLVVPAGAVGQKPPREMRGRHELASAILEDAATAMGGLEAIRALKNQVIVSEGKSFEPQQALRPGGPPRHVSDHRLTEIREPANGRLRQDWDAQIHYVFKGTPHYIRIIDGDVGSIERVREPRSDPVPMDLGQLATRLREERRAVPQIVLTAMEHLDLKLLPDERVNGRIDHILSFIEGGQEFRVYVDARTKLPSQVDILEDDPTYGDSRYRLRYSDWRQVDGLKIPFSLRYEINGDLIQTETRLSVRHNVELPGDTFAIPEKVRSQTPRGEPLPSEWLVRRLAMDVGYPPSLVSRPPVTLSQLSDRVFYTKNDMNSVVIEMRDYLLVVEPALYEANSVQVIAAVKARFQDKPIRYIVPTHAHNDHIGGIRTYIAEGATILAPPLSREHYKWIANAQHTIRPDHLQTHPRKVTIETLSGGTKVLSDGTETIEIHSLPTSHAEDFQVVYLPKEKLLIEADHMSPAQGRFYQPVDLARQLLEGIERLHLNVEKILGIHGDVGTIEQLREGIRAQQGESS